MAKRGKIGQARHDREVQKRLEYYKERDYRVKADLPDRARPPKIGGRIPDIVARKGNKLIVEEIETPSSIEADKNQRERLKEGTEKLGGDFKVKIAKK